MDTPDGPMPFGWKAAASPRILSARPLPDEHRSRSFADLLAAARDGRSWAVDDQARSDGLAAAEERFVITVGTSRGTRLEVSARPGSVSESNHGVRMPCVASQVSHSDPILFPSRPGAAPSLVHWGNTAVDANSGSVDLTAVGNGTCEGGITDRSAYWMPALLMKTTRSSCPIRC